jgi:hypothetical protein
MYAAKVGYPRTSGVVGGAFSGTLSSVCEDMLGFSFVIVLVMETMAG